MLVELLAAMVEGVSIIQFQNVELREQVMSATLLKTMALREIGVLERRLRKMGVKL